MVEITRDNFLQLVGSDRIKNLPLSPDEIRALYGIAIEYLDALNAVAEDSVDGAVPSTDLNLRLPGGRRILKLAMPNKDELSVALMVAVALFGTENLDVKNVTLGTILAVMSRLSKLDAQLGEKSIVDVLIEWPKSTAQEVTLKLFGNSCRNSRAGCRFMSPVSGLCQISLNEVSDTLEALVQRRVLRLSNNTQPPEFSVCR